jgi:hypothetical protein
MMTSRRIALPLAIAVHILLLYALSKSGGHLFLEKETAKPLNIITLILAHRMPVDAHSTKQQDAVPSLAPKHTTTMASVATAPISAPTATAVVVESKESATPQPVNTGAVSLTQSALNAIGKMDQDERRSAGRQANVMSNSLEARLSSSMDKYAPVKAGTIDENIYPDGRREERIHTPFGVVCITYESPSNPVDGFDTMQRGYKPSVPHSCGHRFD